MKMTRCTTLTTTVVALMINMWVRATFMKEKVSLLFRISRNTKKSRLTNKQSQNK